MWSENQGTCMAAHRTRFGLVAVEPMEPKDRPRTWPLKFLNCGTVWTHSLCVAYVNTRTFIGKNGSRKTEIGSLVGSYVSEYLKSPNSTYSLKAEANVFPVLWACYSVAGRPCDGFAQESEGSRRCQSSGCHPVSPAEPQLRSSPSIWAGGKHGVNAGGKTFMQWKESQGFAHLQWECAGMGSQAVRP